MSLTNSSNIPESILNRLKEKGIKVSDILLKTTADLDFAGNMAKIWVIATNNRFIVIPETGLHDEIDLSLDKIEKFRIRASIGSAYLQAKLTIFILILLDLQMN